MQRITLFVSLSLLSGCFPVAESYFEPSAQGHEAYRRDCHGGTGPTTGIELKVQSGRIDLSAERSADRPNIVNVTLRYTTAQGWEQTNFFVRHWQYLAEESTLNIQPLEFKAYGENSSTPIKVLPPIISQSSLVQGQGKIERTEIALQPTLKLKATSPKTGRSTTFRFLFPLELNDQQKEFSFNFPKFSVDGVSIDIPQIIFFEKSGIFAQPFNC